MHKMDGSSQERIAAYRNEHPRDWQVVIGLETAPCEKYKAICIELQAFGLYELLAAVASRLDHLLYETTAARTKADAANEMSRVFEDDGPVFGAVEKLRIERLRKPL